MRPAKISSGPAMKDPTATEGDGVAAVVEPGSQNPRRHKDQNLRPRNQAENSDEPNALMSPCKNERAEEGIIPCLEAKRPNWNVGQRRHGGKPQFVHKHRR